MLDVFSNAVPRPSTVTGADYNQLSAAFFQNLDKVVTGGESAQEAVNASLASSEDVGSEAGTSPLNPRDVNFHVALREINRHGSRR